MRREERGGAQAARGCVHRLRLVGFDGQQREPVAVLVIARANGAHEHQHRERDEREAHERLQQNYFHRDLLGESDAAVTAMVSSELKGMRAAHNSGDMRPESARPTVKTL